VKAVVLLTAMEYYGLPYTVDEHSYISVVEGIDRTTCIPSIVWTIGSICLTTFQIIKYSKRSLVVY
jgi:hypothetical protein